MTRLELRTFRSRRRRGGDFIAERAAYMAYRNAVLTPYLPTLGVASHFRREAVARKLSGRKLLG